MFGGIFSFSGFSGTIGVDFGDRSIRLIQLAPQGEGWRVMAAACVEAPPGEGEAHRESVADLLREALEQAPFKGRRVVSSLSASSMNYKNVRLPQMPADELRAAVEWEASDRFNTENSAIEFYDAGEVRHGDEMRREVILLAAERKLIDDHLNILTAAGLSPVAIDAAPGALSRCLTPRVEDTTDAQAKVIIDVGYASTKVLLSRNGRVIFFKLIPVGGRQLNETVAHHLNMSIDDAAEVRHRISTQAADEADKPLFGSSRRETVQRAVYEATRATVEELSKEIGLCLRYFSVTFRGRRPESACLVGGESRAPHIAELLSEHAGVAITPAPIFDAIDITDVGGVIPAPAELPDWAGAIGLALRGEQRASKRGAA